MASPDLLAGVMLAALIVYALSGGADFGGGVWDLLARGPRAAEHRRLIEGALAPVWEANHVWLIFVVVVLFTAFPAAFAALATRQHGMLTVVLLGIVLRGSALVFRQYGGGAGAARWGAVFAAASAVTPFFLGLVLAGVTAGGGTAPFALALGALAVCLCAFLAAVYLGVEARDRAPELEADLRRRAVGAWIAVAVTAAATGAIATTGAPRFAARLFDSSFSPPLLIAVALAAGGALAALLARRPRTARVLAVVEVALLVLGWGAAHHPLLVAPDIDLASAAAPRATLELLVPVLAIGAAVVLPPFYWLLRVFKGQRTP
ncbi:MAG TPA: cytochrome d ubiquinol oxidase subunit II [Kofleriaceae bacterium]|nr:cytochrome d ubiquinol oxidase subunit II [Kofleriaceae bacterium]